MSSTNASEAVSITWADGVLPDPRKRPTIPVPEAGQILGLSRASAYDAANRGEIPTLRIGRRLVVPTARLLAMLGLGGPEAA
jgi:Helix-turn-helix domain